MNRQIKILLFIINLGISSNADTQNFILNPSFEEIERCPNTFFQIGLAKYWTSVGQTPDLLNTCDFYIERYDTLILPFDGESITFTGISFPFRLRSDTVFREFLQGTLATTLTANNYFVSVQVLSHPENRTNHLDIFFSENDLDSIGPYPKNITPQFRLEEEWIGDYGKWKQHCGCVEDIEGSNFFTIGNFNPPLTDAVEFDTVEFSNGVYIDMVELRLPKPLFRDTIVLKSDGCFQLPNIHDSIRYFYTFDGDTISNFCPADVGEYQIKQYPKNCKKGFDLTVFVEECNCEVFLPSVFSPNNDGINDSFFPFSASIEDLDVTNFKIYNRWGGLVHASSSPWNGFVEGKIAEEGIYTYLLEYECCKNLKPQRITKSGDLLLLR